jgi:two-component system nitrogen regulation sensor histidine kinase NtrY
VKRRKSLSLRLVAIAVAGSALTSIAAAAATALWPRPIPVLAASLLCGGLFTAWAMGRATGSLRRTLGALADGVRGFRASDFSLRLAAGGKDDEIGDLLRLFNEIADVLRSERRDVYQRELLLDTLLQSAPIATVLAAAGDRVVYSNRTARDLLGGGRRLEGQRFREILDACPQAMREGLSAGEDVLFTTPGEHGEETYRAARRTFQIHAQEHTLYTVERLTPELRRREIAVWKEAIRVINHELNNSLAPIRSLVRTGQKVLDRPERAETLREIFQTVEERVTHLAAFLDGYAQIARVPRAQKRDVRWADFLEEVGRVSAFRVDGALPRTEGHFDPALLQQLLINLLKNAHESGSAPEEVAVSVQPREGGGAVLRVLDRGRGMDEEAISRAPLPFYTSKPGGTGLGVPLAGEIAETHGGRLQLENRPGGGLIVTCWLPGR